MTNQRGKGKGLLALLGIGAGVFAWWKYKNMTPEKKEELHAQANEVGQRVKETYNDVESTVKSKFDELTNGAKKEVNEIKTDVNDMKKDVSDMRN